MKRLSLVNGHQGMESRIGACCGLLNRVALLDDKFHPAEQCGLLVRPVWLLLTVESLVKPFLRLIVLYQQANAISFHRSLMNIVHTALVAEFISFFPFEGWSGIFEVGFGKGQGLVGCFRFRIPGLC